MLLESTGIRGPRLRSSLLLAAMLFALGCGPRGQQKAIVVVLKTTSNPYFVAMKLGVDKGAAALGSAARVETREGRTEDDVEGQSEAIRSFLQSGRMLSLVLTPASSTGMVPVVQQCKAAGVPVVVVDTRLDAAAARRAGFEVDAFIGSDNYEGGKIAAERLVSRLAGPMAAILVLDGVPTQETAVARASGFASVAASRTGWVVTRKTANWNRQEARAAVDALLSSGQKIDGIFACNDEMALGALVSFQAHGSVGAIIPPIVGFDATDEAVDQVKRGLLDATVRQQPELMGREAVRLAFDLSHGTPVKKENLIAVSLVTK